MGCSDIEKSEFVAKVQFLCCGNSKYVDIYYSWKLPIYLTETSITISKRFKMATLKLLMVHFNQSYIIIQVKICLTPKLFLWSRSSEIQIIKQNNIISREFVMLLN